MGPSSLKGVEFLITPESKESGESVESGNRGRKIDSFEFNLYSFERVALSGVTCLRKTRVCARVAQRIRALVSGTKGRAFESRRGYHHS